MTGICRFEPIAIVGQGCVLPDALTPDALWKIVRDRQIVYGPVPSRRLAGASSGRHRPYVSGLVEGFDTVFDPERIPEAYRAAVMSDPVCAWPVHAAMEAWQDARAARSRRAKTGVFVANLSYPSAAHAAYAASVWSGETPGTPESAFNSALPARLISQVLELGGPAFSLDAACASSLYALEIACRRLQSRQLDYAVVAAVNAADNLILHIGFDALKALSPSGTSRPFVKGADGLVPSEGAVCVVLKRLSDVTRRDKVYGVIRGIGLSNDGRRKGLLAPSGEGQLEAMRQAYAMSGISPESLSYLECHATGTPTGDSVELLASAQMFQRDEDLPIGSLKANTGHLITAAGLASVLKMTSAFEHGVLAATPIDGNLIESAKASGLRVIQQEETWPEGPRLAGISNFGFGGNNAHLILEQHTPTKNQIQVKLPEPYDGDIALVATGLLAGQDRGNEAVLRRLMNHPLKPSGPCRKIGADAASARTPPRDLEEAEPHQLAILDVVQEALASAGDIDEGRTGVFAAMGCAADSARWLLRERLASLVGAAGTAKIAEIQNRIAPALSAATVLGAMANMTANRLTYAKDYHGMGFSVSADAASGLAALDLALEALRNGTIDTAIVAAADFAAEPVRAGALSDMQLTDCPADQAAAIILRRAEDLPSADPSHLGSVKGVSWKATLDSAPAALRCIYGYAPCADIVFRLAVEAQCAARGLKITDEGAIPDLAGASRSLHIGVQETAVNAAGYVEFLPAAQRVVGDPLRPAPYMFWTAAKDRDALAVKIAAGKTGGRGACRIALLASSAEELEAKKAEAQVFLSRGGVPSAKGMYFGEGKAEGELAFMFTGSAAVYPRMGRGLLMAFPELREKLSGLDKAQEIAPLLMRSRLSEFEQLCAGTLISQAHAILLLDILGIKPHAALGLSLGESNALFAFGFWDDPGALLDEISDAAMYERHLGGDFETAREAWGPNVPSDWSNWRVQAPLENVRREVARQAGVEITIIYSDHDCMIGGPSEACRRVCEALGRGSGAKMHQNLIVHAKAMKPFEETWRKLHTRKVHAGPKVRLYANAVNAAYAPDSETVADMLTRQAVDTVDFPKTVLQAWEDGVRTFVELGPRDTLTQSLHRILKGKPFTAVAADRIETSDLAQMAELASVLFAEGRQVRMKQIDTALSEARANALPRPEKWSVTRDVPYAQPAVPELARCVALPCAPQRPPFSYPKAEPVTHSDGFVAFPPPPKDRPLPHPRKVVSGREPLLKRSPCGPSWDYEAIDASARGKMSDLFGEDFRQQDRYARQVRLPAPPLLLVDRITGIDAEPGIEAKGVIWTETDLSPDQWFIHDGRIRPGPLIECGQADLTLIGWMGADFRNQDERVYRLLGCEITFHEGGLPEPGDTLRFQIEITGHAKLADVRMFFFQYDCYVGDRPVFSVRNGQAGFFSDAELAAGKGVVWSPEQDGPPTAEARSFKAEQASAKRAFSRKDLDAFRQGDVYACFGDGFELAAAQSRPAHLPDGKLDLFDNVEIFDPKGGPWGRGYLKARAAVAADMWFYDGHFHEDPCMPGTLMAEAAVQAMEFYAAAAGLALERDGYVFEPVPGHMAQFICRGQVIPDQAHDLTYEVFIDEIIDGDTPEIYAALLASSDGKKVFYCPRFGLRLRRTWPVPRQDKQPRRIGPQQESRGDYAALLDCANGAPSAAFGDMYRRFDHEGIVPRLPQPPYHMMTRVMQVSTRPGVQEIGAAVRCEYDIPPQAWYFQDNGNGAMPFAVLSEIALQPCGWLASHCGFALSGALKFRNLEGEGHLYREVFPKDEMLVIESRLSSFSRVGPMTIVSFDVAVSCKSDEKVLDLKTQFGFFPSGALARQAGLSDKPHFSSAYALPSKAVVVEDEQALLARGQLCMLDGVDHFDPKGGEVGLGLIRGRQAVDPHAWYFKAHFYQDPVQPGSLGLDALAQLLARAMLLKGLHANMAKPRFETLASDRPVKWSYRGQVTPDKKEVVTVMEIIAIDHQEGRVVATARGSLWRDDLRVYEVAEMSLALVDVS
ncbi:hypothetical protein HY29_06995 [Hyphomonas beringensis]|uniref:Ketosynthase family 3 (KS3) domain-containing protein n=1 Tax=Hyphomonas beringensis TaxID=1280946 RepID=A0A062TYD6_9PROT|nr:type I polyketide synthase [Hyphomonas beringensis]KCZ50503.1 hypothetical protein HY29_06995 [Hyphomonas beringensis]